MLFIVSLGNTSLITDPTWSERVRRRRAFADVELERGSAPAPTAPPAPPAAVFCRHLLAALLTNYAPAPPPPQKPKLSFSIESIIGVQ